MSNVIYVRRRAVPSRASDYGMTGYEWAVSKQRMEAAMLLAYSTLRVVGRVRNAMQSAGRSVRGLLSTRSIERARGR